MDRPNPVHYTVDYTADTSRYTTSPSAINGVKPSQHAAKDQGQLTFAVGSEWAMYWLCLQSSCCRYLHTWKLPNAEKSGVSENKRLRHSRSHLEETVRQGNHLDRWNLYRHAQNYERYVEWDLDNQSLSKLIHHVRE